MAVKTESPQIVALKLAVEKRFGHPIESRADFSRLVSDVEQVTREHLAENTLRRLWGRLKGYETVYTRTLDVLCQYVGYEHWRVFCESLALESNRESDIVKGVMSIRSEDLNPGDKIRMGWLPDRECVVEFVGGNTFRTIRTQNSTLQVGDIFECSVMLKNYPLFVDNLVHGGEHCQRYSIGINHGLTILEKL